MCEAVQSSVGQLAGQPLRSGKMRPAFVATWWPKAANIQYGQTGGVNHLIYAYTFYHPKKFEGGPR